MNDDFYIDGVGSGEFGARLQTSYSVGGTAISRTRQKARTVQGWIPLGTEYGLRNITLPVHIFGATPHEAAERKSCLDRALLGEPIELQLPNGMCYTASLNDTGNAVEFDISGCELACTYKLVGWAHDALQTVTTSGVLYAHGTAPEMACRIRCVAGTAAAFYKMAGVTWTDVSTGDVLELDGLTRRVLRNGANDMEHTDLCTWPTLKAGANTLTAPDLMTVEYYPVWI